MGWVRTFVERALQWGALPEQNYGTSRAFLVTELENNVEIVRNKTRKQIYDQIARKFKENEEINEYCKAKFDKAKKWLEEYEVE